MRRGVWVRKGPNLFGHVCNPQPTAHAVVTYLARNLGELVLLKAGIHDGVRHLVADLVCSHRKGEKRGFVRSR